MPGKIIPKNNNWDWSLLLTIFLYQAIPAVYHSYSIFLIGNAIPNENALAIASQWQTIQVLLEIIQEAILFPIYFFIGSKVRDLKKEFLTDRVASCLKIIAAILIPIAMIVFLQAKNLVNWVNTPEEIIGETIEYLRIRIWAIIFGIANLGLIIIAESLNKKTLIVKVLLLKMTLFIFFDSLLYGGYEESLGLGINGVAYSNILVEAVVFIFVLLRFENLLDQRLFGRLFTLELIDTKMFSQISAGLLIDSLIRNVAYLLVIVSLINALGAVQIGGYYLSMHLFWSILLVPILAISETLRVRIGNSCDSISEIKSLLNYSLKITLILLLGWVITVPFVGIIFNYMNADLKISGFAIKSFYILFIPYCLLAVNLIMDSVFYGMGKTKYLAYQSILTNVSVYALGYIAFVTGIWMPTFNSILMLFSIGIFVDTALTIFYLKKLLH